MRYQLQKENWAEARNAYVKAFEIFPSAIFKVFLSECLLRLDGWEHAAKELSSIDLSAFNPPERTDYVFLMAVVAVESGDKALSQFTATPDRFQLALLDITMPGIDGLTALRRMRELRPALPCIILSGHSEQDAAGHFGGTGATTFLQKPFDLTDLNRALARVRPVA